jgi:hypothetical protein
MSDEGVTKAEVKEIVKEMIDKKSGKREPRQLSKYQEHMSVCLKKGKDFSTCIKEWNEKKK